jgi:hypothetical protein
VSGILTILIDNAIQTVKGILAIFKEANTRQNLFLSGMKPIPSFNISITTADQKSIL